MSFQQKQNPCLLVIATTMQVPPLLEHPTVEAMRFFENPLRYHASLLFQWVFMVNFCWFATIHPRVLPKFRQQKQLNSQTLTLHGVYRIYRYIYPWKNYPSVDKGLTNISSGPGVYKMGVADSHLLSSQTSPISHWNPGSDSNKQFPCVYPLNPTLVFQIAPFWRCFGYVFGVQMPPKNKVRRKPKIKIEWFWLKFEGPKTNWQTLLVTVTMLNNLGNWCPFWRSNHFQLVRHKHAEGCALPKCHPSTKLKAGRKKCRPLRDHGA